METDPRISPDGRTIAFSSDYGGTQSTYIVSVEGGTVRRLSFGGIDDRVCGWTPDGNAVLFRSTRSSRNSSSRLYTVPANGGVEEALPLGKAECGSYSPDGARIAYTRVRPQPLTWKGYRGGRTSQIWIAQLGGNNVPERAIPTAGANDFAPVWWRDKIYFLSDRSGNIDLLEYDVKSGQVRTAVRAVPGHDLSSFSIGPGGGAISEPGQLSSYDVTTGIRSPIPISLAEHLEGVSPRVVKVGKQITRGRIAPDGNRVAFEARGDLFIADIVSGTIENLTQTPGIRERDAAWSRDGRFLAYFSDRSGEYALHIRAPLTPGSVAEFQLAEQSFAYDPVWSPDGRRIAYCDSTFRFWYLDIETGRHVLADHDALRHDRRPRPPVWSADGRFLAYTKARENSLAGVFVYCLESGRAEQVGGTLLDASYPGFDNDGNLYFTAVSELRSHPDSRSPTDRARRRVFVVTRSTDAASRSSFAYSEPPRRVDIPENAYTSLDAIGGKLFVAYRPDEASLVSLARLEAGSMRLVEIAASLSAYDITSSGARVLVGRPGSEGLKWQILDAMVPAKTTLEVRTANAEMHLDPRSEWRQIFHEALRLVRDFYVDRDNLLERTTALRRSYEPYLRGLESRADLNYLLYTTLRTLGASHLFAEGGDAPRTPPAPASATLGGDLVRDGRLYRIERILAPPASSPNIAAPLFEASPSVREGDYILAINGRGLTAQDNIAEHLLGLAGKPIALSVSSSPDGSMPRQANIVPSRSEYALRLGAWTVANERRVLEATNGKVGYIYVASTTSRGFEQFYRQLVGHLHRDALIIDVRDNNGGALGDEFVEVLRREPFGLQQSRDNEAKKIPESGFSGPKVMLINEGTQSGGESLAFCFRAARLGPLIGTTTWGSLLRASRPIALLDGGYVTVPDARFLDLTGVPVIENRGVRPDIFVRFDSRLGQRGMDTQLEAAIREAAAALERTQKEREPVRSRGAMAR